MLVAQASPVSSTAYERHETPHRLDVLTSTIQHDMSYHVTKLVSNALSRIELYVPHKPPPVPPTPVSMPQKHTPKMQQTLKRYFLVIETQYALIIEKPVYPPVPVSTHPLLFHSRARECSSSPSESGVPCADPV